MIEYLFIAVFASILFYFIYSNVIHKKNKKIYKIEYEKSLKGTDKKLALELGRRYYQSLRGNGPLTIYDEQAIANDIGSMN